MLKNLVEVLKVDFNLEVPAKLTWSDSFGKQQCIVVWNDEMLGKNT